MKKVFFLFLLSLFSLHLAAQKEWSNWYFNGRSLLTFKSGSAQLVTDFTPPPANPNYVFNFSNWVSGGISYSDPTTGEMKFTISNRLGYNRNYEAFPNQDFLRSCPDKYAYHILPFHDNSKRFYVIQFQDYSADLLQMESGLQVRCPNAIGLGYSIVDLNLDNGLGDFSIINQQIVTRLTPQMTTVRHANGKDVWIIVHPYDANIFTAYLVTDNGIQPPVSSPIGPLITGGFSKIQGTLTASHDGKMLAGYTILNSALQLFDFDNATGTLSNYRTLPHIGNVYHIQFSPDDSKLYYHNWEEIYQYDFNKTDVAASLTKIFEQKGGLMYDMQLAPDGKIYVTKLFFNPSDVDYAEYIGAIECPNLPQYASNFNPKAFKTSQIQFPDFINDFVKDSKAPPITQLDLGNDTSICFGDLTISAPDGWESYRWNTGETTQKITVKKGGLYSVLAGNTGFSCPSAYGYINVGDKALKLDLGRDTLLCKGVKYHISVPSDYTNILWENGSHTRDSLITIGNHYIISAKDKNGCFTSDSIKVNFKYFPIANFGNDTTLCNNDPLVLKLLPPSDPFNPALYHWQDGSTQDEFTVTTSGKYWGTVSFDGCTASDTINVNYITSQQLSLGNDTTLCEGESLILQSNISNAGFLWSTGEITASISVTSSGSYVLKVSTKECTVSDTINVIFNKRPSFSLGGDTAICENSSLTLNPEGSFDQYLWQDGSTDKEYTVKKQGWFWLKTTRNNCSATDSIFVTVNLSPQVSLGKDTGICIGNSLLLDATSPQILSYEWQDGSSAATFLVKEKGVYNVKVTDANGCINRDTINITATEKPLFSLGRDTVLCETNSLDYNFTIPGASYLWNDGSTNNIYKISSPGIYRLTVEKSGCTNSDSIQVLYKPMPVVALGNDTIVCRESGIILNAFNSNATYLWQDGSKEAHFDVKQSGVYSVKVNLNGCIKSDTTSISFISKPEFSLGKDTMICEGMPFLLQPKIDGTGTFLWQNGSTQPGFQVTSPGLYSLKVTNQCGSNTDEITISTFTCIIRMPNAFTPNQDGLNDVFRVKYPFPVKDFRMIIYNRWGEKVFETTDMKQGWNGRFRGQLQPIGTYTWTISLTDLQGNNQSLKGVVSLLK